MTGVRRQIVGAWLVGAGLMGGVPCWGQRVIPNPAPPAHDSAARPPADTAAAGKPAPPQRVAPERVAPVDTTLAAACAGVGKGGVAQDLVIVVFGAGVGADERAAAVKGAGGSLVSRPGAPDDEAYVRLSAAAPDQSAHSLADRLIQFPQVRSVSLASCPPPPAPPSPPGDSGRPGASPPPVPPTKR